MEALSTIKENLFAAGAMTIAETVVEVRQRIKDLKCRQPLAKVGFVPTMGFFHEGHLSLMRAARSSCDYVVVSIFVNPSQFGPHEDLAAYPRDLKRDLELAAGERADLVFVPAKDEIYPSGFDISVQVGKVAAGLCGRSRPGHFGGVATVVAKLFNIVAPDLAYFGQKDAQQVAVIRRMVKDLNIDLKIEVCPTIREEDGLAMSSRNTYLSSSERQQAVVLFGALSRASDAVAAGEADALVLRRLLAETIARKPLVELEYAEIVAADSLETLAKIENEALAVVAARVGSARLIDNMVLKREEDLCSG